MKSKITLKFKILIKFSIMEWLFNQINKIIKIYMYKCYFE